MESARNITADTTILPSYCPLPGLGLLPVNAFVIKAAQPVLVDTGLPMDRGAFVETLRTVIDPADLRWLWLTHPDPDHIGSLMPLLEEVPHLRLVTSYFGFGALNLTHQIGLDRVYFLNPGESLDVGDRRLVAYKPPTFDNPATTGFYDTKSGNLFSSDCFGALLEAPTEEAGSLASDDLRRGQVLWTRIDSPWLHKVDEGKFAAELSVVRQTEPSWVLSSHLPPARSLTDALLDNAASVPQAEPWVGPNQAAVGAMLAGMAQAPAA